MLIAAVTYGQTNNNERRAVDIYKELEPGKGTDVRGWMDRAEAERLIKEAESRAGVVKSGSVPGQRVDVSHTQKVLCGRKY